MFTSRLLVTVAVLLLAVGLRAVKLGTWSFATDEVASIQEGAALQDGHAVTDDPLTRLPRMTPLGVGIHALSYRSLGHNEFAARLPAAVSGALLCGLAVFGLWSALGGWSATAVGLLLALTPEELFHSQNNRYYALGALLAAASVLAALAAVRTRSPVWMALAGMLALLASFTHLVLAGLFPGLFAVALLAPGATLRERFRLALVAAVVWLVMAAVGYFYWMPLVKGWNAGVDWGYSIPRSLLSGANQLGVPTALFAALGALLMLMGKHPLRWFWAVWAAGWLASLVVLPKVVAFHPGYSFLFLFGPMVLAGYAVGALAERIGGTWGGGASLAWIGVAVLLNAPSLVSYYADGSRHDFRSAAQFVIANRQPGDALAAVSPGNLGYYAPEFHDAASLNPDRLMEGFRKLEAAGKPCWLVLTAGRTQRDAEAQKWLNEKCRLRATFQRIRLDYYDFAVEVYYLEPH